MTAYTKPGVDPLVREQQEIEKRRQRLEERRLRILDAKTRQIGLDVDALDQQVKAKAEREKAEKEVDAKYAAELDGWGKEADRQEQERLAAIRARNLAVNDYRGGQQKYVDRKRAEQEKFEKAPINFDKSILAFDGEDAQFGERTRLHQQQQKDWINSHVQAQEARAALDKARNEAIDKDAAAARELADSLERAVIEAKSEEARRVAEFNKYQAEQKKLTVAEQKQRDERLAQDVIQQALTSSFLTEDFGATRRIDDSSRSIPYNFKGFSAEQQKAILEEQKRQVEENKRKIEAEKQQKLADDRDEESLRREIILMQRDVAQRKAEREAAIRLEQQQQHKHHDAKMQYLNKKVYTNPVSEDYFAQFGTSAR